MPKSSIFLDKFIITTSEQLFTGKKC